MRLGLIAMSGLRVHNPELAQLGLTLPGFIERKEVIASLPSLALLTLAGLTPQDVAIEYLELTDYQAGDDPPAEFDLVAIASYTAQIKAAYALADAYRKLGVSVVLGGLHVSALPAEALRHADAVVLGEGERVWPALVDDYRKGRLQRIYDARAHEFDLRTAPMPRYDLLEIPRYNRLTVQTQRGCPYRCEFCASSIRLTNQYKLKPVSKVVEEIRYIKSLWRRPFIELADDNSFAGRSRAKQLATALAQLDIKWFTETDVSVAQDAELLARLRDSGCRQLLIGFESPSPAGLHQLELKANWKERQLEGYYQAIDRIQSHGISVNGCFILGLDGQDAGSFDDVLAFVRRSGLAEVQITIQTPFPGTELYQRLACEQRLLRREFWEQCTLFDVSYVPDKMSVTELEAGFRRLMSALYDDDWVRTRKARFIQRARAVAKHAPVGDA